MEFKNWNLAYNIGISIYNNIKIFADFSTIYECCFSIIALFLLPYKKIRSYVKVDKYMINLVTLFL